MLITVEFLWECRLPISKADKAVGLALSTHLGILLKFI